MKKKRREKKNENWRGAGPEYIRLDRMARARVIAILPSGGRGWWALIGWIVWQGRSCLPAAPSLPGRSSGSLKVVASEFARQVRTLHSPEVRCLPNFATAYLAIKPRNESRQMLLLGFSRDSTPYSLPYCSCADVDRNSCYIQVCKSSLLALVNTGVDLLGKIGHNLYKRIRS
jgi:hypothetical protein